jgi:hypothetical protein
MCAAKSLDVSRDDVDCIVNLCSDEKRSSQPGKVGSHLGGISVKWDKIFHACMKILSHLTGMDFLLILIYNIVLKEA